MDKKDDDLHSYFSLTRVHGEYLALQFLAWVSIVNMGYQNQRIQELSK